MRHAAFRRLGEFEPRAGLSLRDVIAQKKKGDEQLLCDGCIETLTDARDRRDASRQVDGSSQ